ncbi:MAG: beta-galactosidase [Verrucomicrobia bacterium]|nr:beta-galactosidase [Verrucomicrobiota bacterium]
MNQHVDDALTELAAALRANPACDGFAADLAAQAGRPRPHPVFHLNRQADPDAGEGIPKGGQKERRTQVEACSPEQLATELCGLLAPLKLHNPIRPLLGLGVGPGTATASFGCRLDPKLDHFIRILADRGINVILATPTGSPPDWLCLKHPEIVPVKMDGRSYGTGVRRHTCPTSPRYRENCERIVRAMARRYAQCPSVIGWQIDNEIGRPFCYCPLCHRSFQQWLKRLFEEIETFNFKVGQFFLGRTSRAFEEAPLPEAGSNPCLHQLYGLFMDHQIRECWGLQREWLRQEGVRVPITTNAMLTWYGYDHEKFYETLDLVTGDVYPDGKTDQGNLFTGLAFTKCLFIRKPCPTFSEFYECLEF